MITLREGIKEIIAAQMDEALKEGVSFEMTRELLETLMLSVADTVFDATSGFILANIPDGEAKTKLRERVG